MIYMYSCNSLVALHSKPDLAAVKAPSGSITYHCLQWFVRTCKGDVRVHGHLKSTGGVSLAWLPIWFLYV